MGRQGQFDPNANRAGRQPARRVPRTSLIDIHTRARVRERESESLLYIFFRRNHRSVHAAGRIPTPGAADINFQS